GGRHAPTSDARPEREALERLRSVPGAPRRTSPGPYGAAHRRRPHDGRHPRGLRPDLARGGGPVGLRRRGRARCGENRAFSRRGGIIRKSLSAGGDGKDEPGTPGARPKTTKTVVGVPSLPVPPDRPSDMEMTRELPPKAKAGDGDGDGEDEQATALDVKAMSQAEAERVLARTGFT